MKKGTVVIPKDKNRIPYCFTVTDSHVKRSGKKYVTISFTLPRTDVRTLAQEERMN
jgi:hypothetical protein